MPMPFTGRPGTAAVSAPDPAGCAVLRRRTWRIRSISASITEASRRTPSRIRSGSGKQYDSRSGRSRRRRRRSRCRARRPPGRDRAGQHRLGMDALGQLQPDVEAAARDGPVAAVGHLGSSESSIASRRSPVHLAEDLICSCQSCVRGSGETTSWVNAGGQSMADSAARTSLSRIAGGASTQPTRSPEANVLENDAQVDDALRRRRPAARAEAAPSKPSSPYGLSSRISTPRRLADLQDLRRAARPTASPRPGCGSSAPYRGTWPAGPRGQPLRWPLAAPAGISPSSSMATCTTSAWYAANEPSAPT